MTAGRAFKWVGWASAIVFLMLVLACLAVLVINRNDQPPSRAVVRLENLARSLPPVADKDNGFIYFMGFSAYPNVDPAIAGMQRVERLRKKTRRPQRSVPDLLTRPYNIADARSTEVAALLTKCREVDRECARLLQMHHAVVRSWLQGEPWLAERYRTLLAFPEWREIAGPGPEIAELPFDALLEGQKDHLLTAWVRAGAGDAIGVRQMLEDDMRFWRRSLAGADTLLSKMMAAVAIRRHFLWGSMILRRLPAGKVMAAVPPSWYVAVSDAERSMLRPLGGEWRVFSSSAKFLRDSPGTSWMPADELEWLEHAVVNFAKSTFQLQATSNRQAELMVAVADAVAVSYVQLPVAVRQMRLQEMKARQLNLWDGAYNLLGKIVLSEGASEWAKYVSPIADLEGIRRATLLLAQTRSEGVAASAVRERIMVSPVRDPYDGRSFAWSDAAQAIVFTGLAEGARGRTVIPY